MSCVMYNTHMTRRFTINHLLLMALLLAVGIFLAWLTFSVTHGLVWPLIIGINTLVALLAVRDHALILYHSDQSQS